MKSFKFYFVLSMVLALGYGSPLFAQVTADSIFSDLQNSVFQIRIVEEKSGSQAALGTGFLLGPDRIATNYHVVSMEVLEPERFHIEVDIAEETHRLSVLTVDVVNDLAILAGVQLPVLGPPFQLAQTPPKHGSLIYSLGNPHNLGMTIVQGNYNGLVEHNFFDRIHYSGAINSGMSGGPAVDSAHQVVGINVASAGNQVGFLVPVAALDTLLDKSLDLSPNYELLEDMAMQIGQATDAMLQDIDQVDWPVESMGKVQILGKTVNWMECWGNSNDDKDQERLEISRGCNNADNIYLSHRFQTGFFEYEYYYLEAPTWPATAFYRKLRSTTSSAVPGNQADKDNVGNYTCENAHVEMGEGSDKIRRRMSFCTRPYKKLKGLFDVFFIGVTEDHNHQAAMDHFTLAGVRLEASQKFFKRFVQVLKWQ